MNFTSRFAPSPTGLLHLGNARTAVFAWLAARREEAPFVLRIEDTDRERSRAEYTQAILEDLHWLGIRWDEGPDRGGRHAPYLQSERFAIYGGLFDRLVAAGHVYPCYCSGEELENFRRGQLAQGRPPRYAGTCRNLTAAERAAREAEGRRPTLRFRVPVGREIFFEDAVWGEQRFSSDDIGDFIVRRADGTPAFFFANAVDDSLMEIGLVLRGEDHLSNTPRQLLILDALGLPPPRYGHLPLILGTDGQPLSKRNGSRSLRELREGGWLPEAVMQYLARLGHHYASEAWCETGSLAENFDLTRISRAPARYGEEQMGHWQREAVLHLPWERLWAWLAPSLSTPVPADRREPFVEALRPNVLWPAEAQHWAAVCFGEVAPEEGGLAVLTGVPDAYWAAAEAGLGHFGVDHGRLVEFLKAKTGRKGKDLFLPLRVALTGRTHGPELARLLPLMGTDRARRRIHARRTETTA